MLLEAVLVLGAVGLVFGSGLAVASRFLAVNRDERMEAIEEVLPGANCGACGVPGCGAFATAVVEGSVSPSGCTVGGAAVAEQVAGILGVELDDTGGRKVAHILCQGKEEHRTRQYIYDGPHDCRAMHSLGEGSLSCQHGCLHLGTCIEECPFDAIEMGPGGVPVVNREACTACGICVRICPRGIISLVPEAQKLVVECSHPGNARDVRADCKAGCLACRMCVRSCPQEAWSMDGNLPVLDNDKCQLVGTCLEKCPTKVIKSTVRAGAPVQG